MELLCPEMITPVRAESENQVSPSSQKTSQSDERVLGNFLLLEQRYRAPESSKQYLSDKNRRMLTTWLLEICEEQRLEPQVFPLAVSLVDRCLARQVPLAQLQLVGAACLFIAAKMKACSPPSGGLLVKYTEDSITLDQLLKTELLVASWLGWDLASITATDFLEPLLGALGLESCQQLLHHASTLAALSCTDWELTGTRQSAMSVGCVLAALEGLQGNEYLENNDLVTFYSHLISEHPDNLRALQKRIEKVYESFFPKPASTEAAVKTQQQDYYHPVDYVEDSARTPTDVRSIGF